MDYPIRLTLIRGLSREQFHWERFPDLLKSAFPNTEIEFLDLPGNGKWNNQMSPLNSDKYLSFLRTQSTFVKQKKTTSIIAVSLAAMIAHEWAHEYPHEIGSLVLMNTSLRPSPLYHRIRPLGLLRLLGAARIRDSIQREKKILELTTHLLGNRIDVLAQEWGARARSHKTSLQSVCAQLWTASNMRRQDKAPPVPCLILSSQRDALVNSQCSEELALNWQVPHRVHLTAGHDLTLDDPDWVIAQLKFFYDGFGAFK